METGPRSLSEDLRSRTDTELAELLTARPELAAPVPADLSALAGRLGNRASVLRALDLLDLFALEVVEGLLLAQGRSLPDLLGVLHMPAEPVEAALGRLRRVGLLWGGPDALHLVGGLAELVRYPGGLGPPVAELLFPMPLSRLAPLVAAHGLGEARMQTEALRLLTEAFSAPGWVTEVLAALPPNEREVLDHLDQGVPVGQVPLALEPVRLAPTEPPVRRLLARGLLVGVSWDTVVMPREVGLALRGGRALPELHPEPPPLRATAAGPATGDRAGAAAAGTACRLMAELLEGWGLDPPAELKAGGLGVRELRRAAGRLDLPEPETAALIETAYAAGLLGRGTDPELVWLPSPEFDSWRNRRPEQQWLTIAAAWLDTSRVPGLVGTRDERDRPLAALGPELDRPVAAEVRRSALATLAELPPGVPAQLESLREHLLWTAPRRFGGIRDDLTGWTLAEAQLLGVVAGGALTGFGRALLTGDGAAATGLLAPLLPEPLDHVLLQADLTAIAPGPLEPGLAREMALVADVESTGGATTYRFSEASVRRALDAGRSAADLHELLRGRSRTPVPQPLSYLVDDAARRHGRLRVGTAQSYLRCDDPGLLAEVLAARSTAQLRLRRLAPTVLTARAPVARVLEILRGAGYSPAAETAEGDVVVARRDVKRSPTVRQPPPWRAAEPRPTAAVLAAAVKALRAGDRVRTAARGASAGRSGGGAPLRSPAAQVLQAVQEAAQDGRPLLISYVNGQGAASERIIEPRSVDGGYVRAYDSRRDEVRTFALHRITSVAELVEDDEIAD